MRDILPPTPFYLLPFSGSLKKKAFEDTFFFGGGEGRRWGGKRAKREKKLSDRKGQLRRRKLTQSQREREKKSNIKVEMRGEGR